jgi:hypothetical protein
MRKYNVLYTSGSRKGQVGKLPWAQAHELNQANSANFISNTLYRAAKLGINISKLEKKAGHQGQD